jgi:hypothetical protein
VVEPLDDERSRAAPDALDYFLFRSQYQWRRQVFFVPPGTETSMGESANLPNCTKVVSRLMLFMEFLAIHG